MCSEEHVVKEIGFGINVRSHSDVLRRLPDEILNLEVFPSRRTLRTCVRRV